MAEKRMKFQRKLARQARKPVPPPPSPQESSQLASAGVEINRGGSDDLPITPEGHAELKQVGEKLAAKGGIDAAISSGARRTDESAAEIAGSDPVAVGKDPDLKAWSQGNLEGQPKASVKDELSSLVRKDHAQVIPGQGAITGRHGESFDQFRTRYLTAIRGVMQALAQKPQSKIGIITHSSGIKLLKGWLDRKTPDDMKVKPSAMEGEPDKPGTVERLFPGHDGHWQIEKVDLASKAPLEPGIYLIRHGMTPWNKENTDKANQAKEAARKISAHVKSGDYGRARAVAQKASSAGHLTDDQINGAIDAGLPSPQEAGTLPIHHLIATASAARPPSSRAWPLSS